jgi:hypothetical protein
MAAPPKRPGPFASKTPNGPDKEYRQIGIALPRFYLRVLVGEAAFIGMRRSQILELLVLRKAGLLRVERAPSAPRYRVERKELEEVERYLWHCRTEIKEHLDRMRERMGNLPPRAWVILALNEWIGLPSGVGDLSPA